MFRTGGEPGVVKFEVTFPCTHNWCFRVTGCATRLAQPIGFCESTTCASRPASRNKIKSCSNFLFNHSNQTALVFFSNNKIGFYLISLMAIEIPSWILSIICFDICQGCLPDSRKNIHFVYTDPCSITFMGVIKWLQSLMIKPFLFCNTVHCNNTIIELICAPHHAIFVLDE